MSGGLTNWGASPKLLKSTCSSPLQATKLPPNQQPGRATHLPLPCPKKQYFLSTFVQLNDDKKKKKSLNRSHKSSPSFLKQVLASIAT